MIDKALNTLDGFTIEEWREKYRIADTDRLNNARLAGEYASQIQGWSNTAQYICYECNIDWPVDVRFDVTIIDAVKELKRRNLDLSSDVGKLSAITVVALDLLKRLFENSREPAEGECIYCNCEDRDGHYEGCIMIEVRKLLIAADGQGQGRAAAPEKF